MTKKSYAHKQGECEASENELKEITQLLSRLGQEKLVLNEQLKNLNADSPFAEEYRNDSHQLKQKQSAIQQLRADVEAIETRINSTRTQLEIVRHELEVTRGDEADYERENERLRSLLDIKRGVIPSNKIPASMSNGSLAKQVSNSANIMKSSQSNGSLRSATPKGTCFLLLVFLEMCRIFILLFWFYYVFLLFYFYFFIFWLVFEFSRYYW